MGIVAVPGSGCARGEGVACVIRIAVQHGRGEGSVAQFQIAGLIAGGVGTERTAPGVFHRHRPGADRLVKINAAIGKAGHQRLEVGDVVVGNLNVVVDQPEHLQNGADLLDLHDLLGRSGVAVDGQFAHGLAVRDPLRHIVELGRCAVLADVQRDHVAVLVNDPGVIQHRKIGSCAIHIAVVKRRKLRNKGIFHPCGHRRNRQRREQHQKRKQDAHRFFEYFPHSFDLLFSCLCKQKLSFLF